MSKFLPRSGLKWVDPKKFDLNKYSSNSSKECILEVDLKYPKELCELHNNYLLATDKIEIKKEILSSYQLKFADFYDIPIGNFKKLVPKFFVKKIVLRKLKTLFNPFQDEGGKPSPSTRFSPATFTRRRITHQNILTFSFDPFAKLVYSFKAIPSASIQLLNLNQDHLSKKWFFWSNFYKIKAMITSLIEILELPKFGHTTTSRI